MHRTTSLLPLSPRLSANWQESQFWLAAVLQSSNTTPFWATHKRSRFRLVPIAHAQFTCNRILSLWLSWLRLSPSQSDIWWLTTARRNSCQPVLVHIYRNLVLCPDHTSLWHETNRNCAILEAWLPFMTCWIFILRTLLSGWSFLFNIIYANRGDIAVIASTTYMNVMNTPPPSPLRWQW